MDALAPSPCKAVGTWTADELVRQRARWRFDLPEAVERGNAEALSRLARAMRRELLQGSGLVHLGAPSEDVSDDRRRGLFARLGRAVGTPLETYGLLYEVADRGGASYRDAAIPVSMTASGTGFHTDSSAHDVQPDVVALLCERPAAEGGDSLVSNARCAHAELREHRPELLEELERPLVRDIVTPGRANGPEELRANRIPVFQASARPEGLLLRYMRYWIERGQAKVGEPLGERAVAALDALDEALARPANVHRLRLDRGESLWINNRFLAHNRTEYVDDPAAPRRLWRLWLTCEEAG